MDKKKLGQIIHDYHVNGLSYRTLGKKYKMAHSGLHRMINDPKNRDIKEPELPVADDPSLPDDVKTLKEELRKAKLKIELQDLMIDIASKELGVDIRKKSGTRRS